VKRDENAWAAVIDGGTTNTRVRLVRGDRIVAVSRRTVGVRDAVRASCVEPLAIAIRECLEELKPHHEGAPLRHRIAAGMVTADVGLCHVPHVVAPASVADVARAAISRVIPEISDCPILFVPGVRTPPGAGPDNWTEADVMRGEECETFGAWLRVQPRGPSLFLWPGSHTKLVSVDPSGRIVRSTTTLAGELMAAVARHTVLAASLPAPFCDVPDTRALAEGAHCAREFGLGRAAFLVRLADLTNRWTADDRAGFWLGAIVSDDISHLARGALLSGGDTVWVGGRQPLRALYRDWLEAAYHGRVIALDDDVADSASALGAMAIAEELA
jgi:2-dehydro-3-deoxygalactonokinase